MCSSRNTCVTRLSNWKHSFVLTSVSLDDLRMGLDEDRCRRVKMCWSKGSRYNFLRGDGTRGVACSDSRGKGGVRRCWLSGRMIHSSDAVRHRRVEPSSGSSVTLMPQTGAAILDCRGLVHTRCSTMACWSGPTSNISIFSWPAINNFWKDLIQGSTTVCRPAPWMQ
ncbi:hypothetical protein NP493_282g01027 [Ridgeia piscesae]|uniref:Uncharacterized protein n=1 Tax=Ridgeia piscesae TaxID=27915 RepID=A0AAD9NX71_RIDPI|nr:hypothetical protein NP493_282g01027 [Ridgeia piscesae]